MTATITTTTVTTTIARTIVITYKLRILDILVKLYGDPI